MGIRIVDDCDRYGFVLCHLSVAFRVGGLLAAGIGGTVSLQEERKLQGYQRDAEPS
jgi:hypothetical protein